MRQPDFTKMFFEYSGDKPKKIKYILREGPYRLHDIVFLSSFMHDARFYQTDMKLRGQRLSIDLERDCWELGFGKNNELHIAKSKLIFTGVTDVRWTIEGLQNNCLNKEMWINYFYLTEDYFSQDTDYFNLVVAGYPWKLLITMKLNESSLIMQDIEIPHFYSKKKKA